MAIASKYRLLGIGALLTGVALSLSGVQQYSESARPWRGKFNLAEAERGDGVNPVMVGSEAVFQSVRPAQSEAEGESRGTDTAFRIRLDEVKPESGEGMLDELEVDVLGDTMKYDLAATEEIFLQDQRLHVLEIRRWSGLLREPQGGPMLSLSLKVGDEVITGLVLRDGESEKLPETPTLSFRWCQNEEQARQLAEAKDSTTRFARWGVDDRGVVHWFTSFLPGTGAELSDGSTVTLMRFDAAREGSPPRLIVEHSLAGETQRYELDSPSDRSPVYFENPLAFGGMIGVYAWSEHDAVAVHHQAGVESVTHAIDATGGWSPLREGLAIRVDQVLPTAVFIPEESSPLFEVVLQGESGTLRVRQGEAVRLGDALLRFTRRPKPGPLRYYLGYQHASGKDVAFDLGPGERQVLSTLAGTFILHYDDIQADAGILLRPSGSRVPKRLIVGVASIILGLAAVRMRRAN